MGQQLFYYYCQVLQDWVFFYHVFYELDALSALVGALVHSISNLLERDVYFK